MSNQRVKQMTVALSLVIAAAVFGGCKSAVTGPEENLSEAPKLPKTTTMKFELDFFGVEPPAVDQESLRMGKPSEAMNQVAADRSNWINGFIRALFVQLVTYDVLEEPIAAFALAIHSVPQRQLDGSYLWTYIFVDENAEYSIFLYGTPLSDRVAWRMEVSSNDPNLMFDHFVWFDGESMNDERQGFWQFYTPVEETVTAAALAMSPEGEKVMRIDWFNDGPNDERVRITVKGETHPDHGDYLEFHETPASGRINLYDASEDVQSNITWFPDGSGSLTVPDYNDGQQACWDTEQLNTECQ